MYKTNSKEKRKLTKKNASHLKRNKNILKNTCKSKIKVKKKIKTLLIDKQYVKRVFFLSGCVATSTQNLVLKQTFDSV